MKRILNRLCLGVALACSALSALPARAQSSDWVGAWTAPQSDAFASVALRNQTIRQIVTVHQAGHAVRVRLSNRFGTGTVVLNDVRVGLSSGGADVVAGSAHKLLFGGKPVVTLAPGASIYSDPVALTVQAMQRLAISVYARGDTKVMSRHFTANEYPWRAMGNQSGIDLGWGFTRISNPLQTSWMLVDAVDVQPTVPTRVLVAFGDSITDGFMSSFGIGLLSGTAQIGQDHRYPDYLARRLIAAHKPVSVVNAGISGNRLLKDAEGPLPIYGRAGLSRLQRDVLDVPGVTDAVVMIGANDLGHALQPNAADVITGLKTAVAKLKQAGVRVTLGTIPPTKGNGSGVNYLINAIMSGGTNAGMHGRASVMAERLKVNDWIRTSGVPDVVVDFDACLRDPADPARLRPEFDSGDHLHPSAKGYEAMAACVNLTLF
ncbi:MAG: GDSL-type esterase/lipase family protein [Aquabacterium sp.]|nr:GDSL-type esterase/lipase family protein [Aquabacterium sp.]